jgi:hypothetical protein
MDHCTKLSVLKYPDCSTWRDFSDLLRIQRFTGSLWLSGFWNRGEPACYDGSGEMITLKCSPMLETTLNSGDSDQFIQKRGGTKTFDHVVWSIELTDGSP